VNVAIVDSGGANIGSVCYALDRLGARGELTSDEATVRAADRVILPGVGAAAAGMRVLDANGMAAVVPTLTQPVLGICLGMQLMFEGSEEDGGTRCLGIFSGQAKRFESDPQRRVPHMGWNRLHHRREHALLRDIADGDYAYFVHSYALPVNADTLVECEYGDHFAAIVQRENFHAAQFHPERSAKVGAQILKNFLEI